MKKRFLIIIVIIFGAVCGYAQRENADTVSYEDWRYLFPVSGWDTANFFWTGDSPQQYGAPLYPAYLRFSAMQPVTIYGVAVVSEKYGPTFARGLTSLYVPYAVIDFWLDSLGVDSNALGLYALLIQQDSGGVFRHLDSARWHPRNPDQYFKFMCNMNMHPWVEYDTALPMYEFYFERPHTVLGDYYVGFRSDYVGFPSDYYFDSHYPIPYPIQWSWDMLELYQFATEQEWRSTWYVENPGDVVVWHDTPRHNDTIIDWLVYSPWLGMCPILAPPDTDAVSTLPVEGLRRDGLWNGRSVFVWNRTPGQLQYQVAYGPASQPPDSHSLFFAYQTSCSLPVADSLLDPTVPYAVRCRAQSHHACALHDTLAWSDWSDPVEFYPSRSDTALAAACPQKMGFSLSPNPARDRVAILLPDGQAMFGTLVIRDVSGRERLRCKVSEAVHSLPIHGLPIGTYFVTVATNRGCFTQKLIVK